MEIYETDLPGVGKRFEFPVHDGTSVVVVVHNTGQREIFLKADPDADGERMVALSDEEARALGSILEGIHFQPTTTDGSSTLIGGDTIIEWHTLADDSPLAGRSIEDSGIRDRTGVTVMAVERGPDAYPSPGGDFELQAEDTLVTIGRSDDQERFEALLAE